jgi:hypothetical protein
VRILFAFKPPSCFMDYSWIELKLSLQYQNQTTHSSSRSCELVFPRIVIMSSTSLAQTVPRKYNAFAYVIGEQVIIW